MNEDFKEMRYLSHLLARRSEKYYFTIEEIKYILGRLHVKIKDLLANFDPVKESLELYDKIVRLTDRDYADSQHPVSIELTGAEAFTIMLCLFMDPEYSKMRNKLFYDLYLGLLGMVINDKEEEV